MVERTRSLLKDAILSNPGWALQQPMKHPGLLKLRYGKSGSLVSDTAPSKIKLVSRSKSKPENQWTETATGEGGLRGKTIKFGVKTGMQGDGAAGGPVPSTPAAGAGRGR